MGHSTLNYRNSDTMHTCNHTINRVSQNRPMIPIAEHHRLVAELVEKQKNALMLAFVFGVMLTMVLAWAVM